MLLVCVIAIVAILGIGATITAVGVAQLELAHPPAGRLVQVVGGRLHVVDLAPARPPDAPPIVLLHGASGNLEDQRLTLGAALAVRHRVVLVDRPGHGFSDRPGGRADASPGRQAALIAQALARLGVSRAIVVGHSWSGALAAALALDFPERVAGLVLVAPVTHPWPGGISWYNRLASTPVVGRLFAETCAFPIGSLLIASAIDNVFEPQLPPADYVRHAATRLVLRPQEFVANAQDVAALKPFVTAQAPRYGEIAVPTVIISGDRDTTVRLETHSRVAATLIPGAKLIVLPGIGHMPHHVAADAIVAAIEALSDRVIAGEARQSPPRT
jgi:pimeloyl-ACP methyl ester carboxylesterase